MRSHHLSSFLLHVALHLSYALTRVNAVIVFVCVCQEPALQALLQAYLVKAPRNLFKKRPEYDLVFFRS